MYPAPGAPSRDPEQIPVPLSYIPVSGGLRFAIHPDHRFDILRRVRQLAGPDISVHGEVTSPFDYLLDSFGYENGLMLLLDDPDRVDRLMQRYTEGVVELATEMCKEDIDAVKISSPFAGGGFLSRDHYNRIVVPYERQIVEAIQRSGRSAYIHTCGAIGDRLDLMAQTGVHGIECLDPPPLGNVDLEEALRLIGGAMFVKGNIDSVNAMLLGTEEAMVADVRDRLRTGKSYSKFILSTACSIAPHVRSERIVRLRRLVEDEGKLC
jgi:uroporphyrinogen-III decarboxylase